MFTAAALVAVIAITVFHPVDALAQHRGGGGPRGVVFVGGYFYDPFFGPYPWWGPGAYGYPYFPIYDERAQVRVMVTPKEAMVYVDGYYAGPVDDFDGALQSLPLSPGAHDITIYMEGYHTVTQRLYLPPRKSYKLRYAMQPSAAGEKSEMPALAPPVPPPPPGSAMIPHPPISGAPFQVQPAGSRPASGFGTVSLRVQPGDAEILIDGEPWNASAPGERLVVQLAGGTHHIEIRKSGYRSYTNDITVQPGDSMPLNVSLSSQ
jgi:PEGA domain